MSDKNIDEILGNSPEYAKLYKIDDTYQSVIIDEELDPVICTFNNDECVEIDTRPFSYLVLSKENLLNLLLLIDEAETEYTAENE